MKNDKIITIKKENTGAEKYGKNHKRNQILVNLITGIRSLGTIAIVPIYCTYGAFATGLAAAGFFLTDFIDGFLARKLHVQSFFGSLLDALSDKAFGIVCLLLLSTLNPVFLAIIGLELGIFAINYHSIQNNNNIKSSYAGKAKTLLLAGTIVGSFFSYDVPTVRELLNYINVASFTTLVETNPNLLSTILAIPAIGASLYVAKDYVNIAKKQEDKEQTEPCQEQEKEPVVEEDSTLTLEEIAHKKEELLQVKSEIEEAKKLKSREEILFALFDTDYYLANKDAKLKSLLYKQR